MGSELEEFLRKMRPGGSTELDLSFGCLASQAYRHGLSPHPHDLGLVALSRAVERGVQNVYLVGDNRACQLAYESTLLTFGSGVFSQTVKRGLFAPVHLSINGKALTPAFTPPAHRFELKPKGRILAGFFDVLAPNVRGQVLLIDRGIAFPLGSVFGSARVLVRVAPLEGAPWPTRLILDKGVASVFREVLLQVQSMAHPHALRAPKERSSVLKLTV